MSRVYIYEDMEGFTERDFEKAIEKVSATRRMKAMSYLHASDRKQAVIAELLLRHALKETYGIGEMPGIHYGEHDKPMLRGEGMPHFNLSHCALAVGCVVSDEPVGIDAEPYSSHCEEVAREVFDEEEYSAVKESPALFAEIWTKKESYLKYTGEGLTDSLKSLLRATCGVEFRTFHREGGYACTVCSRRVRDNKPIIVSKTTLLDG